MTAANKDQKDRPAIDWKREIPKSLVVLAFWIAIIVISLTG